jgi:hypothetical protein
VDQITLFALTVLHKMFDLLNLLSDDFECGVYVAAFLGDGFRKRKCLSVCYEFILQLSCGIPPPTGKESRVHSHEL